MDGILNINKPSGMTSHDVVLVVRRMTGEKRVGHTGTLDPLATGVLVLCLGKATRIAQYLEAGEKEYRAVMRLGVITDTLDAAGRIVETRDYSAPGRSTLLDVLKNFTGRIIQQPPVYSAIKVGGVPSYKLARLGKAEPLKPREVSIYGIELTAYDDPFVSITVQCSKGVYIRTLCADIGAAIGSGAHLTNLVRSRSGRFGIDCSLSLGQLEILGREGQLEKTIVPVDEALSDFPSVALEQADADRITHGSRIRMVEAAPGEAALLRIHGPSGGLLALGRMDERGDLKPELVFS